MVAAAIAAVSALNIDLWNEYLGFGEIGRAHV